MTKQEKIREGMSDLIYGLANQPPDIDKILKYLHSQGVMIKVDRELPHLMPQVPNNEWSAGYCCGEEFMQDVMVEAGYEAVESLIEEAK